MQLGMPVCASNLLVPLLQAVLHMEQRKQEQEARNAPPANSKGELKFHPVTGAGPGPREEGLGLGPWVRTGLPNVTISSSISR